MTEDRTTAGAVALLEAEPVGSSMVLDGDFLRCPGCGRTVFLDAIPTHARRCAPLRAQAVTR